MNPIKNFFSALLLLAVFLIFPVHAQSLSPSMQLSQLLQRITTFQAQFSQKTLDSTQQVLQKSNGIVSIQRPGKFRWETREPTHQIVIANANTLWIYDVDLMQATKQSLEKAAVTPAKLLSGETAVLLQKFRVQLQKQSGKSFTFVLFPKNQDEAFRSVSMTFVGQQLQRMDIVNTLGQINRFDFFKVKQNQKIDSSLFDFKPPAGVDVLR